jgi:hypothetical protein
MKTDHLAVIARGDQENIVDNNKTATSFHIRKQTPAKNALFMSTLASIDWSNVLQQTDVQLASDLFYKDMLSLLDMHYPIQSITD